MEKNFRKVYMLKLCPYRNIRVHTLHRKYSNVFIIKFTLYDYKYEKGLSDVLLTPIRLEEFS